MDETGSSAHVAEHTLTTERMTGRSQRVEVITRGERRRIWSLEQKQEIVFASMQPGARPVDIARLHSINTGQLYTWRRQMMAGLLGGAPRALANFARVGVADTSADPDRSDIASDGVDHERSRTPAPCAASTLSNSGSLIEIILLGGIRVRVDIDVDSHALRRVLVALEGL